MDDDWRKSFSRILAVADAFVIFWAMSGALILRFGAPSGQDWVDAAGRPYILGTIILSTVWWVLLSLSGSRDTTVLGHGTEEYKRLLSSSFWLFGFVAAYSYVFQVEIARGYVVLALPAGVLSLLVSRLIIRSYLRNQRAVGRSSSAVMLIGGIEGVEHLTRALRSQPMAGYLPIAAYLPQVPSDAHIDPHLSLACYRGAPQTEAILDAIRKAKPDVVALSSGVPLPPRTIRELGWALTQMQIRMIMAPALTDVAGPRIHTQPVAGLPLIHVSTPNLGSGQGLMKRGFDLVGACAILTVLAPVMAVVALLVRADSPGPVLFMQERVGAGGKPFRMYKFRSMVVDAEARLEDLRSQTQGNGVLFKLKADPRITRVGRHLRRYSLDELPQLFNVINGSMSLVGPRPPLASEVGMYQRHVHRRLMVRPGLTGLWQVSGRSLLSWEDTVRLDLYYVENWSLSGDIAILLKTFRAVISRHGAY